MNADFEVMIEQSIAKCTTLSALIMRPWRDQAADG